MKSVETITILQVTLESVHQFGLYFLLLLLHFIFDLLLLEQSLLFGSHWLNFDGFHESLQISIEKILELGVLLLDGSQNMCLILLEREILVEIKNKLQCSG